MEVEATAIEEAGVEVAASEVVTKVEMEETRGLQSEVDHSVDLVCDVFST